MSRNCNCAGSCGPYGVTRRELMLLAGSSAAAALAAKAASASLIDAAAGEDRRGDPPNPGEARVYLSYKHTDARMHLGGIGTGNFEIGADGQLTTWQLFNTLRDGYVPCFFVIKAGEAGKLLQTSGGPEFPRIHQIEMRGEYPCATLTFHDADLPVRLQLEAFTPFSPLDTRLSSMPAAVFLFKVHNPTQEPIPVSIAALMRNPAGYDAMGPAAPFSRGPQDLGTSHPNFGGAVNRSSGRMLLMECVPSDPAALDRPLRIYTNISIQALNATPAVRPRDLQVDAFERLANAPSSERAAGTVIWLEDPAPDLDPMLLEAARRAVEHGAILVLSGDHPSLIAEYVRYSHTDAGTPIRPDVVFQDFEHGYGDWKVEGTAFGTEPARGTLPNQQPVSGFTGQGLVNSYLGGDAATGRLISPEFTIQRRFIRFRIGGGSHPGTQMRLIVEGRAVRTASGRNSEALIPAWWDVREFAGRTAHIEIVDEETGGWGHINVDDIVFSDLPAGEGALRILADLMPAYIRSVETGSDGKFEYRGLSLRPGAREQPLPSGHTAITRPLKTGAVAFVPGRILDPAEAELAGAQHSAYREICALAGAAYHAPRSATAKSPGFGSLALAALAGKVTTLPSFIEWMEAWEKLDARSGFGANRHPQQQPTSAGKTINGGIASSIVVPPGKTLEVPFILSWWYPNKYNAAGEWMGNHYSTVWPSAADVAQELMRSFSSVRRRTQRFRDTFYATSLPYWLLDCLTSQMATIRHIGVVFRIANGDVYGWEGSNGCCQPTCTHVWGYEQTLSRVFPELEREMRRVDFLHQQRQDGGINNRTDVPSPPHPTGEHPFADGHASTILKAYREALNYPDDTVFREYWPRVQRAVEYLIARDAASNGGEPQGILQDDQWNTYDEALHGVTTFISGYYLAALRAGEEWARRMGDARAAERYRSIFRLGQQNLMRLCWNGEYFQQHLPGYEKMPGEVGPGCMSDQLIGQWWAHQLGLGYILPREHVASALRAIVRYNWKPDLTGWHHAPRAFAGNGDQGLIICTWPRGGRPPIVMLYSDEVWTGIEYQVAAHLIYEGMLEEAFTIIKGARGRYDGIPRPPIPRNPWNEIECGGHYARAMSSWSILLAASGFHYDGPAAALTFKPRIHPDRFQSFFSGPLGWGSLVQVRRGNGQRNEIRVVEGSLRLAHLHLQAHHAPRSVRVSLAGRTVAATWKSEQGEIRITMEHPVEVPEGKTLAVVLS
ncbi:MAG: GH116 family glycosyl hydrolase [Chthonomonadales bacterium]